MSDEMYFHGNSLQRHKKLDRATRYRSGVIISCIVANWSSFHRFILTLIACLSFSYLLRCRLSRRLSRIDSLKGRIRGKSLSKHLRWLTDESHPRFTCFGRNRVAWTPNLDRPMARRKGLQ